MGIVKNILIGIAGIWVFVVIGGALLSQLFGTGGALNSSNTDGFIWHLTSDNAAAAAQSSTYGSIIQAVAGFIPLIVILAFILPVLGGLGMGGYMLWSNFRDRDNGM